ncbi:MAG: hypothetical protein QNJ78_03460 [Gammaproteobacteria bacterium]|nr:hypothetical protein [Gammaproteobacteria bacterium]
MTGGLQQIFKWIFLVGLAVTAVTYFQKDRLPEIDFYETQSLSDPRQTKTHKRPFETSAGDQTYHVEPLFDYELHGVVVSYHDADSFTDITHHRRWQDFLNIRDLCVVWGENVSNGVYREMDFSNDSWTCWAYWDNAEIGSRFSMSQLSNNHLLTDDEEVKRSLMSAQVGDHIRLIGVLASYANPGNGFRRGTSTVRTDMGNGACETIYLHDFEIVNQANGTIRRIYAIAKWLTLVSLLGFIVMFFISPVRQAR